MVRVAGVEGLLQCGSTRTPPPCGLRRPPPRPPGAPNHRYLQGEVDLAEGLRSGEAIAHHRARAYFRAVEAVHARAQGADRLRAPRRVGQRSNGQNS